MNTYEKIPYLILYIFINNALNIAKIYAHRGSSLVDTRVNLKQNISNTNDRIPPFSVEINDPKSAEPQISDFEFEEVELHLTTVNIKNTFSTNKIKYKFNPNDGSHTFLARSPYLIERVVKPTRVLWNSDGFVFGDEVFVGKNGNGESVFRVYFPIEEPETSQVHIAEPEPPKTTRKQPPLREEPDDQFVDFEDYMFTLNVNSYSSSNFVEYIRRDDEFTDIYIPRLGYQVNKIMKEDDVLWTYDHGELPAVVFMAPDEYGKRTLKLLFPSDLKGKIKYKCPRFNHLYGLEFKIKDSNKINDRSSFELSSEQNISIISFKDGVKCIEVRYLGERLWRYGDFNYKEYPASISYIRDWVVDIYLNGPFISFEKDKDGVWHNTQIDITINVEDSNNLRRLRPINPDEYEVKGAGSDFNFKFLKDVRCKEVWYRNELVWKYVTGRYPLTLEYVEHKMIIIHFPSFFLLFLRDNNGNWNKYNSNDSHKRINKVYPRGSKYCLFKWIKEYYP